MKVKKLAFNWSEALKEAQKNHKYFNSNNNKGLDSVPCYDTNVKGYEIRREGVKKHKFVLFGYNSICLIPVGGHSKKLGEFKTFEQAEESAQKHFDEFVKSLCETADATIRVPLAEDELERMQHEDEEFKWEFPTEEDDSQTVKIIIKKES